MSASREPDDEVDPGPPIDALARLRASTAPGFADRVRGRIHRRSLGLQVLELSWFGPILVAVEFLAVLFGLAGVKEDGRDSGGE